MKGKLIWAILALAFLFRFVAVSNFPAGFNADEASFGYDAYSILHTGRDQWGNFLPIVLKSFGDYKSPVYAYLSVPSVAIFGLNIFATRLPSVTVGTLAVLAVYLLVQELVKLTKWSDDQNASWLGLIAAFILAVNPWSIMISRGAAEFNLITFFLPMGIYFFLKGIRINKYLIWSSIFFGVDMFTYHSAKVITPVVLLGLLFIFRKEFLKINIKKIIIPALIFLIFFAGLLYTFKIGGGSRITERSIAQGSLDEGFTERMSAIAKGQNSKVAKILHNKYTVIANSFITNYLQYFSPKYLIESGAGDGSYAMIPGIGAVYFLEVILLFGTIPLVFLEKKSRPLIFAILMWLLITPLTGALASGIGYSGNRASGMLPALQIIEAFGFLGWILLLKKFKDFPIKIAGVIFAAIFVFEIYGFANAYFKTPTDTVLGQMLYGNLDAASWLAQNSGSQNVLVSRGISEPQIFLAFADKWDPSDFQRTTKSWNTNTPYFTWVDQLPSYSLGKYTIKSIDWKKDIGSGDLIVARPDELTGNQIPAKVVSYPDAKPDIYIIDTSLKSYAKAN